MSNEKVFYVEMKNEKGEYEPLGIMTMQKAIEISWNKDHAALQFQPVPDVRERAEKCGGKMF